LMVLAVLIHFGLISFAFKPLWRAYFWADKQGKPFARRVNVVFFSLILSQIVFLIGLLITF